MVVKSKIKLIKSLQQKKYRIQNGMFVAEGIKTVQELVKSAYKPYRIFAADPQSIDVQSDLLEKVTTAELRQMSGLKNPSSVIGVFYHPKPNTEIFSDWTLVLDDLRDPGNMGTIIRLCDWFGIRNLICSLHTVDCYNPKVLQASMGSIARVNIRYTNLDNFLREIELPIFGAFMEGNPVYAEQFPEVGVLIMGNEANGISEEIEALITSKIAIPQFAKKTAESLNVATATAILLNEIRRA